LVTTVAGRFQDKTRLCRLCGNRWTVYEEKETDVNIAATLIGDAGELCPTKRIVVAFPPRRHSADLKRAVDGFVSIGDDKIRQAQFPEVVVTASGVKLRRPDHWARPSWTGPFSGGGGGG
jgi:hypothetical protein